MVAGWRIRVAFPDSSSCVSGRAYNKSNETSNALTIATLFDLLFEMFLHRFVSPERTFQQQQRRVLGKGN